jgi:hypothetical protein
MEPSFLHIPVDKRYRLKVAVVDLRKHGYGLIQYSYCYVAMRKLVILGEVCGVPVNIQVDNVRKSTEAKDVALGMLLAWLFDLPSQLLDGT